MTRAAIIVVGGAAARLGGVPKPWLSVQGRAIVDHVLDASLPLVQHCVLVGSQPRHWTREGVVWTQEQPAGSGPAAAIAAGVAVLPDDVDEVLLLAGDAPFIKGPLQALLADGLALDAAAIEHDGQLQYLCARVRRPALATALANASTSMRSVFAGLRVQTVPAALIDADTWEDVSRLRQEMRMNDWLTTAAAKLGIDPVIDIDAVLDVARDVAHNTERKNAPLTAYLLGYAAAQQGMTPAQIAAAAADICEAAKAQA